MAKRSTASRSIVVRQMPAQSAPIIRVAAPRAPAVKKRRSRGRSNGGGGGMTYTEAALTGAGVGILLKQDFVQSLPTIGPLGKVGTLGLAAHFFGGSNVWARRVAKAAAIIAGYQYMHDGSVQGDE